MLGTAVLAIGAWTIHDARQPGPWQHVLATREGMIGGLTSSGTIIRTDSMFVALPHPRALGRTVEVRYHDRAIEGVNSTMANPPVMLAPKYGDVMDAIAKRFG